MLKPVEPDDDDDSGDDPMLDMEQQMVRMVAIRAVDMVDDILDAFDDGETAAYFAFAVAAAGMGLAHCILEDPKRQKRLVEMLVEGVNEHLDEIQVKIAKAEEKHNAAQKRYVAKDHQP